MIPELVVASACHRRARPKVSLHTHEGEGEYAQMVRSDKRISILLRPRSEYSEQEWIIVYKSYYGLWSSNRVSICIQSIIRRCLLVLTVKSDDLGRSPFFEYVGPTTIVVKYCCVPRDLVDEAECTHNVCGISWEVAHCTA